MHVKKTLKFHASQTLPREARKRPDIETIRIRTRKTSKMQGSGFGVFSFFLLNFLYSGSQNLIFLGLNCCAIPWNISI